MADYRKVLAMLLVIIASSGNSSLNAAGMNVKTRWLVNENSSLRINGKTNVNTFSCEILSCDQTDTLRFTEVAAQQEVPLSGSIHLNVSSFDCHKAMMTRDLRKTLKARLFPRLGVRFLSLSQLPDLSSVPRSITGRVEIELVGKKKMYTLNYKISIDHEHAIRLEGSRDVTFSDFNLVPPKKLGGLVRTNDTLNVSFDLKMVAI